MSESPEIVGLFGPRGVEDDRIRELLGARELLRSPRAHDVAGLDAVAAWTRSASLGEAHAFAAAHGLPLLRLEEGFLGARGDASEGAPLLSLLVDDLGAHDDPSGPSRLERLLEEAEVSPALSERAAALREEIVRSGVSRESRAPAGEEPLDGDRATVLVVPDERAPDRALTASVTEMVAAARSAHPSAPIAVKAADELAAEALLGASPALTEPGVRVVSAPSHPSSLLRGASVVYVASSHIGFEALLRGLPVHCFGGPFYAGWGLTRDRLEFPRRNRRLSLDELVACALVLHPRYVDPERGVRCEVERVVEHLALQRRLYEANARRIFAVGFSRWKRAFLPAFLESPGRAPVFVRDAREAARRGFGRRDVALVWGASPPEEVERLVETRGGELHRVEDGFLRSVRLGAEIEAPASLVIDTRGIYFDPTRPSDLETMLESAELSERELARARALREAIVTAKVSKYNVGARRAPAVPESARGRVLLVPGQVEDDASILLGGVDVRTNLALLREARRARPGAFILYKPHPDVWGGHRRGAVDRDEARELADLVVTELGLPECLEVADEVHTITSLVGFEALLRGLRVVAYGLPFYAGWGLTEDRHPHPRRTRHRTLDELVACALIRYPRYRSARTGEFASPEHILEELDRARREAGDLAVREGAATRLLRKAWNAIRTIRDAR